MGDWYDKHFSSTFGTERSSSVKTKPSRKQAALLAAQPIKAVPSGPMERYNALDSESKNDVLAYGLATFALGALGATAINAVLARKDDVVHQRNLESVWHRGYDMCKDDFMKGYDRGTEDSRQTDPDLELPTLPRERARLLDEGWHDEPDPNPMYAREHHIKHGLWRPL